ncbi:hypothetical protein lbkm_1294 [Lachnospiraceae bacterium KM106-2]|nr:hypothetical protein lbkm_1294 [Lachnospiraceae bacterium KM106-2]
MQKGEYFSNLHQYIENIDADLKIDETGYEQRLSVCKTCDLLEDAMCRGCGCFVELRGVMKKNHCPYDKW